MPRTRLSPVDAAWLQMEEPDNLMMITAVLRFPDRLDVDRLRRLVADGLVAPYPRFGQRLTGVSTGFGRAAWVDDEGLDVADHVTTATAQAPGDEAALRSLVSRLLSTPLDLDRSPWQLVVVDGLAGGGTALVARLHHAIADGIALASVLLALTEPLAGDATDRTAPAASSSGGDAPAPPAARTLRQRVRRGRHAVRRAGVVVAQAGRVVAELVRLLTSPSDPPNALRGALTRRKEAGWSEPLPLDRVKAVASGAGVTVNDVLLAVTAGALRTSLLARGEEPRDVRASVPVDLRPPGQPVPRELGNRFGLVFVPLPVSQADPLARLRAVGRGMTAQKGTAQAVMALAVLTVLGRAPKVAERLMVRVVGSKTSCIVTNVPGPRERLSLAGSPVDGILFWVPQAGRVAVGLSVFSYAGQVGVGVASDAAVLDDPQAVADAVPGELEALAAAVGLDADVAA